MKSFKYILPVIAMGAFVASCDTDIETVQEQGGYVVPPVQVSELYYQNLREYKATDHEIAFGWFSKYGGAASGAIRFAGLPDSIDLISLWGGIPRDPLDMAEMRECQTKKGIKFMPVDICRINKAAVTLDYKKHWMDVLAKAEAGDLSGDALDAAKHEVMVEMGLYNVDQVFNNDLDGFDIDFEPEGDPVQGALFYTMLDEMAKYLGPNPNITKEERYALIAERYGKAVADKPGSCDKLLCIDAYGQDPGAAHCEPLINYFLSQSYHGMIARNGYPSKKVVHCVSVGEGWNVDPATGSTPQVGDFNTKKGLMYDYARWKPEGGKGGFGGFIINDDYNICPLNPYPYARFRDCIQICNPAIY
ncbi:MAG: glycosyl hydrolase [Muribaculaceae bacterium]|nr:glycosyl hydrolase [Muribaculaceae bacterium]